MKSFKTATNSRKFVFEVEDAGDDAVIVGGDSYYGGIIFDKATAENPAFDFAIDGVTIYGAANSSGVSTEKDPGNIIFKKDTGYLGVTYSATAGDRIVFSGSFLNPTSASADGLTDISVKTDVVKPEGGSVVSSSFSIDAGQDPTYFG